jgi:cytochrome c peroxidase
LDRGLADAGVAGRFDIATERRRSPCCNHRPHSGVDGAYAARTASKAYRTTPLRGLWRHLPYFHDGSAATLADVVTHYNRVHKLGFRAEQQRDLVEYLKSL